MDKQTFVEYLQDVLIPGLRDSGMDATADDFATALKLIEEAQPAIFRYSLENRIEFYATESVGDTIASTTVLHGRLLKLIHKQPIKIVPSVAEWVAGH